MASKRKQDGPSYSYRTPAKHALMDAIIGKEAGSANTARMRDIDYLFWLDLTAGSGWVPEDLEDDWAKNCSPGILAYHAIRSPKPVFVVLHEKDEKAFRSLEETLDKRLLDLEVAKRPDLRYVRQGQFWTGGQAVIQLIHGDGSRAQIPHWVGSRAAVLVTNDPNSIVSWAMRPQMAWELTARTRWFRSISTMGCNVDGQKRRFTYEERVDWFRYVDRQIEALPRYRDALLVAIDGDASQWAYLICDPVRWRDDGTTDRLVDRSFGRAGLTVNRAWLGLNPDGFAEIRRRLTTTENERKDGVK